MERRRFLASTASLTAAATLPLSGCIGGEDSLAYRDWMPASFDPSGMYIDVPVARDNTSLFQDGGGSMQYGVGFDDISGIVGTSDADVITTKDGVEPQVSGDELGEYGGFTIYDPSGTGYVGSDGDTIIESDQRYAITSVVDAQAGEIPRMHEENSTFAEVTSAAGDGDLVLVPAPNARTAEAGLEVKAATFGEEGVDVTFAVELGDVEPETVEENVDSVDGVSVADSSERGSGAVLVMSLDVEGDRILEFFGLAAGR